MSTQKPDLRVVKTKQALSSALLQLLKKSSFSKITVNDICSLALVSRTTFYLHFEDKYQLLRHCLEQMRERFERAAAQNGFKPMLLELLSEIQRNNALFKNLLVNDTNFELIAMINRLISKHVRERLTQRASAGERLRAPVELAASFVVGGALNVLRDWATGSIALEKEQLADQIEALMMDC